MTIINPQQTLEHFELALNSAKMGTFEWDIINNRRYWDDKTHKILGTTPGTYDGTADSFYKIIHPEDREFVKKCLQDAVSNCGFYETHYRVTHSNGDTKYIKARGKVYEKEGTPHHMIGICWDYTEQAILEKEKEEIQRELFHTAKLASIGTLTASIAHEISNPLTVIKGYIEHFSYNLSQEDAQTYIVLQKALRRISSIVSSLKKVSRNEGNASFIPSDAREALEETLALFAPYLKDNDILISKDDTALSTTFLGDIGGLQQVFINLITNSSDALKNTATKKIRISLTNKADKIVIDFLDNGPGINSEMASKIFDPFFTTKARDKGTGLGLYICKNIITQYGGSIEVESIKNLGTNFTITLPLFHAPSQAESLIKKNHQRYIGKTIIIVDDEDMVREMLKTCLRHLGFEVFEAPTGEEALQLMKERFIDVLLTDIFMPKMSGDLLLKEIQQTKNKDIIKIILTGFDLQTWPENKRVILQDKSIHILQKPFDMATVIKALEDSIKD